MLFDYQLVPGLILFFPVHRSRLGLDLAFGCDIRFGEPPEIAGSEIIDIELLEWDIDLDKNS